MQITRLSPRQREIYRFTQQPEPVLILHGAVRSGKTLHMTAAFLIWAMANFDRCCFGICGKTIASVERNILRPLQAGIGLPYSMQYSPSKNCLTLRCGEKTNDFYLFGGRDESSFAQIQGVSLCGVMMDEVTLMPESFVSQAMARCIACRSAKYFFSCNPEGENHWFYQKWIREPPEGTVIIHFTMEDNPILTPDMIRRTRMMFSGVFYRRYILGQWCAAEGVVYPMFDETCIGAPRAPCTRFVISMDYGIQNPTAMLLWGFSDGVWYQLDEYYHSGRDSGVQKTDQEYYEALVRLAGNRPIDRVVIDPSASSFIALVRQKGQFRVQKAKNAVRDGIQQTAAALSSGKLKISPQCVSTIREYGSYVWGRDDTPVKDNDHAMDATRYFVATMGILRERQRRQPVFL